MNPFTFTTEVSKRGYDVVYRAGCRVLTDCIKPGQKYRAKIVHPLDDVTLHTDFSMIKGEDSIIAFANRFGCLCNDAETTSFWLQQVDCLDYHLDQVRDGVVNSASISIINDFLENLSLKLRQTKTGVVMTITPPNLLTAIWLQFALTLDAGIEFKKCKNCGATFEVSLGEGGRSKRAMYCNDNCKHAFYRSGR